MGDEDEGVEAASRESDGKEDAGAGESTSRKLSAMGGSPWTAPEWPPAHCKGKTLPASPPKVKGESRIMVKGSRRRLLVAGGGDVDGETTRNDTMTDATIWKIRKLLSEAPTELVLDKKPPDPEFRNQVYGYLRNFMASSEPCTFGKCQEAGPNGEDGKPPVSPWPCIFKTKNEACKDAKPGKHAPPPALYKGSLGSCAFIGTGEQLLQGEFGPEIDAHDSVIRYNNPIKGYEKHVGTKTTLMWVKGHYKTTAKPTLGYFDAKVSLPKGANVYDVDTEYGMRPMRSLRNELVNVWLKRNKIKDGKPAAGLMRTQMLIKSGYCTSIDLYGFSTKGSVRSGKYFDKKAIVTKGHTIDWDGWILSAMMDLGYICIYGQ